MMSYMVPNTDDIRTTTSSAPQSERGSLCRGSQFGRSAGSPPQGALQRFLPALMPEDEVGPPDVRPEKQGRHGPGWEEKRVNDVFTCTARLHASARLGKHMEHCWNIKINTHGNSDNKQKVILNMENHGNLNTPATHSCSPLHSQLRT